MELKTDDSSILEYLGKLSSNPEFSELYLNFIKHDGNKYKIKNILESVLNYEDLRTVLTIITKLPESYLKLNEINIIKYLISDIFYDNVLRFFRCVHKVNHNYIHESFYILISYFMIVVRNLPICHKTYVKFMRLFDVAYKFMIINYPIHPYIYKLKDLNGLLIQKIEWINRSKWDYTLISVFPSAVDFYEKIFLPPNNTLAYKKKSISYYFDTQFKILKEDFVDSVRKGIEQLESEMKGVKQRRNYNLTFYDGVIPWELFENDNPHEYKICHIVKFSNNNISNYKRESNSKRFMNGSLLFFSDNTFTTFIIATVESSLENLNSGLKISVVGNPRELKIGHCYDMIEATTLFEPYFQSLKAIQWMNHNNFGLIKYIIFADMKPVFSGKQLVLNNNLNLNETQNLALEAAVTKKFTIIQGPPGTGKTYLARAIISSLLNCINPANYPILVICLRNNALDFLLEPIVSSGIKVTRLGRQSKIDILSETSLYNLRKKWCTANSFKTDIKSDIKEHRRIILDVNVTNEDIIKYHIQEHEKSIESFSQISQLIEGKKLLEEKVQIIGATTAGAARYHHLLSYVNPKAVLIEEAGEAMEAFTVTSIPECCDHVILIGDHFQLGPSPASYKSKYKHKMHISLFERMIKSGMKYYQLNEQHRMRPEIAGLISPLIYKQLSNHSSVYCYPDVIGMSKNVFFLKHKIKEDDTIYGSASHRNSYEGKFVMALARYLLLQGYQSSEITILVTYSDQCNYIESLKTHDEFKNLKHIDLLKVQTVDNYQGQENNIILLSLVRSNTDSIGFLNNSSRLNVALSRAKVGLYIIGNMDLLLKFSDYWGKISEILESQDSIGDKLQLKCEEHKVTRSVSTSEELLKVKYGICTHNCREKLKCGHTCPLPCHKLSKFHELICEQPCLKKKECGHSCSGKCYQDCCSINCMIPVSVDLACGHGMTNTPCFTNYKDVKCPKPCDNEGKSNDVGL